MSEEVIHVLQHYRHDLMNRLQIVQGYLSMGKTEKAEEKLYEVLNFYNEERKLMSLNVPAFMLWILEFNSSFENFRLTYKIHAEYKNVHISDSILLEQCQEIMEFCIKELDPLVLYQVNLELQEVPNRGLMKVDLFINGETSIDGHVKEEMKNEFVNKEIDIDRTIDGLIIGFSVPCQ
ncbi:Spo0B domain-containing protein [Oceanobacillus sp. CF4.6]|uniref:Spo0B domain-containing protein n=1 Tax=Oceanobacillus sp. CF4.6 TaxID=3373080 RepID=UPI003EE630E2